jgi:hypothetical protein
MFKKSLTILLACAMILSCSPAHARGWHGHGGRWVGPAFGGLAAGIVIGSLMHRSNEVYVYNDPYYYRRVETRYIYVGPPQEVTVQPEEITVNILNPNHTVTSVTMIRTRDGWIGPQGEYYATFPTVQQLTVLYGK